MIPIVDKGESPILCDQCGEEIESRLSVVNDTRAFFYHQKCYDKLNHLISEKPIPQSSLKEDPKESFEKIISDRISYFQSNYHAHEAGRLTLALNAIRDLIPPSNFAQSSLTPKSISDSEATLIEEIRWIKAVIIHFATLDKMPTLELLDRERLIAYVVTIAQQILRDYPPK